MSETGPQEQDAGQHTHYKPSTSMTVEWALIGHPAVAEVVAVELPTMQEGSPIRAFVVPQTGWEPEDPLRQTLQDYALEIIGPSGPPVDVRFVESLPKTRTGKVMRRSLGASG